MNPLMFTSSAYTVARSHREEQAFLVKGLWMSTSVKLPGEYSMFGQVWVVWCQVWVVKYYIFFSISMKRLKPTMNSSCKQVLYVLPNPSIFLLCARDLIVVHKKFKTHY